MGETQAQRAAGQALTACSEQIALSLPDEMTASAGVIVLSLPHVGGVLVGGASKNAPCFEAIVRAVCP